MAVAEQTPYIEHTGNGVTTSFALKFQCESKDHLIVLIDDIEPPIATWSLTGGNVVFTTAPAAGKKITIQRNTPFSRTTDYQSYNNSFRPPAVNKDFDWIWWKLQELGVADWILGNRVNALKSYVDRKDDELKAYLLEEIRKQGVALDQLDDYYNYLMKRLAQIAVDKGWDASFVVDGDENQHQINNTMIRTVVTITDLIAINNPKDGQTVFVKDQQGGDFVYKSALADQNDGVIVFNGWGRVWTSLKPNPTWAGAKGDGVADDSEAIQKIVEFAIKNKISIESNSLKYAISKTLIIPNNFDNTFVNDRKITLDFGESDFIMTQDVTLFTSGYYDNGVLKTNYDTPKMFVNSFQVVLSGFTISSRVGYLTATMLKIQDWHQGCEIKNIASHVCRTMLESNNNFYTKFTKIDASYSEGGFIGTRFIFENEHNLCAFERLSATNSNIGYQFNASLTACTFRQNSLEGMNIGAQFNSAVYDLTIADCYEENFGNVAYQFNDYAFSVKFIGGYCNFIDHPEAHFLEYKPSPGNDIHIDSGYHFANIYSKSQIIKNKENDYGIGIIVGFASRRSGDISKLNVDNAEFGNKIDINQKLRFTGFYGNVNNELIAGNYSGRYTLGFDGQQGFKWVNDSSGTLKIQTAIKNSQTQKIYVNLAISNGGTPTFIAGEFIGGFSASSFYKYTNTGLVFDTGLSISVVDGFVQINGTFSGTITNVVGEVRLI